MKFLRFLQYNNAVPITLSLVLLGAGSAYAAGNPEAFIESTETVLTVDNTYIANKDLATYTPEITITGVTEDEQSYYVSYDFTTIDIKDYVWQDVMRSDRIQVWKQDLDGGDLGLYVTARFRDIIANERSYLAQVQEKERKAVTQQTIAVSYSGLIGRFMDATTETLPGYVPVVEPKVEVPSQPAAVVSAGGTPSAPAPSSGSGGPAQVALQVLGNNPATIELRSSYIDLGVVLLDPYGTNVGVQTYLDGTLTSSSPIIDTSVPGVHIVEYKATDPAGGVAYVKRIVLVGDVQDPGGAISSSGTPVAPPAPAPQEPVAPTPVAPAPEATPAAPQPEPEPQAQPTPEPSPTPAAPTEGTETSTPSASSTPEAA